MKSAQLYVVFLWAWKISEEYKIIGIFYINSNTAYFYKNSEPRVFKVHLKLIGTGIFGDHGPQKQLDPPIQFWPNF